MRGEQRHARHHATSDRARVSAVRNVGNTRLEVQVLVLIVEIYNETITDLLDKYVNGAVGAVVAR